MSDIEKAIMELQEYIGSGVYNGTNPPIYINTVIIAIQALEKQIPKKVSNKCMHYNCPSCFSRLEIELTDYCADCGQKLDWSVE